MENKRRYKLLYRVRQASFLFPSERLPHLLYMPRVGFEPKIQVFETSGLQTCVRVYSGVSEDILKVRENIVNQSKQKTGTA
jgi:hypothetical protein